MLEFTWTDLQADELRGLYAGDILINVNATLLVCDGDLEVYTEEIFPVVELARGLARWSSLPSESRGDFEFDSMLQENPGEIRTVWAGNRWRVGSIFRPEV